MTQKNRMISIICTVCLWGVAAGYLFVLVKIILLKYGWDAGLRSVSLIPFQFVSDYLSHTVSVDVSLKNILGNFAIFIPLGLLAPALMSPVNRWWKGLLTGLCVSAVFELLQFIFGLGASDVDDLLLNTFGATAGSGLYFGLFRRFSLAWKTQIVTLAFLCLFGMAGVLSLWLYAPGELPAVVETINAQALEGLDTDSYTYSGTPERIEGNILIFSQIYQRHDAPEITQLQWPLAGDTHFYSCMLSCQYSPNGNVQKTILTYALLDTAAAREAALEQPHVFADIWVDEAGVCTAVVLTTYQD